TLFLPQWSLGVLMPIPQFRRLRFVGISRLWCARRIRGRVGACATTPARWATRCRRRATRVRRCRGVRRRGSRTGRPGASPAGPAGTAPHTGRPRSPAGQRACLRSRASGPATGRSARCGPGPRTATSGSLPGISSVTHLIGLDDPSALVKDVDLHEFDGSIDADGERYPHREPRHPFAGAVEAPAVEFHLSAWAVDRGGHGCAFRLRELATISTTPTRSASPTPKDSAIPIQPGSTIIAIAPPVLTAINVSPYDFQTFMAGPFVVRVSGRRRRLVGWRRRSGCASSHAA